jgi:hypothetical protein
VTSITSHASARAMSNFVNSSVTSLVEGSSASRLARYSTSVEVNNSMPSSSVGSILPSGAKTLGKRGHATKPNKGGTQSQTKGAHQAKQRGRTKPNKGGAPSQTKGAHQAKQRGRTKPQAYKPKGVDQTGKLNGSNWQIEIRSTLRWMPLDGCNIAHLDSMLPIH